MARGKRRTAASLIVALTITWVTFIVLLSGSPQLDKRPEEHVVLDTRRGSNESSRSSSSGIGSSSSSNSEGIVFGIASSSELWSRRKEFIRLWWKPGDTRGFVWLEKDVSDWDSGLPPVKISDDKFGQSLDSAHPTGIRISRILVETFKLRLPGVQWFVMCDDDTIFSVANLVRVLSKYDPAELHYIGGISESHRQNVAFSYGMAFGGAGFAISYALAEALVSMQDECLEHYPKLVGSDDRVHACISELGVPLTREPGFHQFDIRGNAMGLLASHPVAPFVSLHHVEAIDPVFPDLNTLEGLEVLSKAMQAEGAGFLQQAMCYDRDNDLTLSVTSGYLVQVFPGIVFPKTLERAEITFASWNRKKQPRDFDLNTRTPFFWVCKRPSLFYMSKVEADPNGSVHSQFRRFTPVSRLCARWSGAAGSVNSIRVVSEPLRQSWYRTPRRRCCRVGQRAPDGSMNLQIGNCKAGETIFWGSQSQQQQQQQQHVSSSSSISSSSGHSIGGKF